MANVIKRGESILIPFLNGESVRDSQLKPRIYRSKEQYERFSYMSRGAELVEYAEVVRCKDCKHRRDDEDYVSGHYCVERPSNGGRFCEDNDFCSYGERREGE